MASSPTDTPGSVDNRILRERPSYTPTIVTTIFFGLVGLWPATRHSRMARERGYSTGGYWVAFWVPIVAPIVLTTAIVVAVVGVSSGSRNSGDAGSTGAGNAPTTNWVKDLSPTGQAQSYLEGNGVMSLAQNMQGPVFKGFPNSCVAGAEVISNLHPTNPEFYSGLDAQCKASKWDTTFTETTTTVTADENLQQYTFKVVFRSSVSGQHAFTEEVAVVDDRYQISGYAEMP